MSTGVGRAVFLLAFLGGLLLVASPGQAQVSFDYSLSNFGGITVTSGGSGSTTVSATLTAGKTQVVRFSVSGLPSGATASLSLAECAPTCQTVVTIVTTAATPSGTYPITVSGNPLSKITTFNLVVVARFDYSLSNSGGITVTQGGSGSTTVTATLISGESQSVSFSVSGLPSGATAAFSLTSCFPTCSTSLTITTAAATPSGTFPITVTGSPLGRTTSFNLVVNAAFNYALANSGNLTVTVGASGTTTITATLTAGQTQSVSFAVSGLPSGATAALSLTSCSPTCSTTVTVTTTAATPAGTFPITVTGNPLGRTTVFNLVVNAVAFNYSLANSGAVTVTAGGSGTTTITATLTGGQTQAVSFTVSGLPSGATAALSLGSCSPTCSTTLTIATVAATPAGTFPITVTGSPLGRTTVFNLVVSAVGFNYSLTSSGNVTVAAGASGTTTITATLIAGTTQPVSFTVSGLPVGVTAAFSAPACSPTCSTTLTITAAASAPASTSTITVTGSPLGRTTTFTLTVTTTRALTIVSGNNQTGVINGTLPRPLVVSVTPPNPSVTVIWQVTGGAIPSATSTPTVNGLAQITLTLGPTPGSVTVTASIAGDGAATSVVFVVNDATSTAVAGLKTYSVLGNLALTTASVQATNIGIRLAALRRGTGTGGVSVSGLSLNVAGQPMPMETVTTFLSGPGGGASGDASNIFGGLGIFLNGQGSFGDQDATSREPGFKFDTKGLTLGSDYRLTENVVLGAAFGYLRTSADLDQSGGRVTMNGYTVSAFGSYYVGDKAYVDAIATYGWNDYGVTRNVTFGDSTLTAKADPDGNQFSFSTSAGYNFTFGPLTAGPTARITYINVRIDGFQERGADVFNLRVNRQTIESLATDLGAQISYAISTPWGVLSPLVRAEWEHEFKGGNRVILGSLLADPLRTTFGAATNSPDRNYANLAAGVTGTFQRGVSAFAHYETVLGRANVINHSFTAGVRFQFD